MSLSFVLSLTVNPETEGYNEEINTLNLQEFQKKLENTNLVGYLQFTYSAKQLHISSLFVKEDKRGKSYGLFLMIFYLCAFIKYIHNSYYIKKILLDDDSDFSGTTKSIYYLFGFRTKSVPTMDLKFFQSRKSLANKFRNNDPSFENINNIIDYYNFLLKKFESKLLLINKNFIFELSNITDTTKIEKIQLNIQNCMIPIVKQQSVTRSVALANKKAMSIKKT